MARNISKEDSMCGFGLLGVRMETLQIAVLQRTKGDIGPEGSMNRRMHEN
jgi:hypothetical protein